MKITVELNTVEEMEQFLEAWKAKKEPKQEGFDLKPMPMAWTRWSVLSSMCRTPAIRSMA